ncbi:type II secretion system protein GspM [Aliagarivorans marinus]|uniref:type II secretion system protein GspM n=1 Tax=Aliagarivorans marinus TaxID=561965 RepID=UPI000413535B|nr:type II secretion system protein M [Aliagarivorans marinus]
MKQWWQGLNLREQQLVGIMAVLVLIAVLFWGVWRPVVEAKEQQQQRVTSQQQTLSWVRQQGELLLSQGNRQARPGSVNVNQAVSSSARQQAIKLARIQPRGDEVEVWIEDVVFDRLVNWLRLLDSRYGIVIDTLDIEAQQTPGVVNVRRLKLSKRQ